MEYTIDSSLYICISFTRSHIEAFEEQGAGGEIKRREEMFSDIRT